MPAVDRPTRAAPDRAATGTFWVETLGCPKNEVDSDKIVASLLGDGLVPASSSEDADLVVVNTCAFVEAARQESVETVLDLSGRRRADARVVVTGCMAERYGAELAEALPEVDAVVGFAGEGALSQYAPVEMLAGRKPVVPLPDFADAFETQRVLEAAIVSARERRPVSLKEIT